MKLVPRTITFFAGFYTPGDGDHEQWRSVRFRLVRARLSLERAITKPERVLSPRSTYRKAGLGENLREIRENASLTENQLPDFANRHEFATS